MENYSLLMGAGGDEDGGGDGSGVDGEAFRGTFPASGCRNRDSCPPDLGFAMAAALEFSRIVASSCAILCSLEAELQKRFEHQDPCDMMRELKLIFETHPAVESYEASKQFFSCMMEEGNSVSEHMFAMSGHAKKLADMGMMIPNHWVFIVSFNHCHQVTRTS
ncbi:hypothetical protein QYE76_042842 [Lolium multiflorum]|uniref:Uncharacterized protein n=1 Tax=Lolium multiflorum TaxID=4521 RepID=A0AAD8WVI2_LOLMU|nr:hypothetical protein QYE76_042842 [Lolium multiflorum]